MRKIETSKLQEIIGDKIKIMDEPMTWEESITNAGELLIKKGSVQPSYVEAMIKSVHTNGPYIVIAPNIAFAHARPEDGANETDIALLISKQAVAFSEAEHHQCKLIFAFAAKDNTGHLEVLTGLSEFLGDEEKVEGLINADSIDQVKAILG